MAQYVVVQAFGDMCSSIHVKVTDVLTKLQSTRQVPGYPLPTSRLVDRSSSCSKSDDLISAIFDLVICSLVAVV